MSLPWRYTVYVGGGFLDIVLNFVKITAFADIEEVNSYKILFYIFQIEEYILYYMCAYLLMKSCLY